MSNPLMITVLQRHGDNAVSRFWRSQGPTSIATMASSAGLEAIDLEILAGLAEKRKARLEMVSPQQHAFGKVHALSGAKVGVAGKTDPGRQAYAGEVRKH
jgi:hypothetical protein